MRGRGRRRWRPERTRKRSLLGRRGRGRCGRARWRPPVGTQAVFSAMAHKPKRTFRQRRVDDSDSDGAEEPGVEPGTLKEQAAASPAEESQPSERGRAEEAEGPSRARGPRGRGRGRVWATSRRAAGAALRAFGGSGVPGSRVVDLSSDEEDGSHHSSERKDNHSPSSDSSSGLAEKLDWSAGEEDGTYHSSESKNDQSPSSDSSTSLEKRFSPAVKIPDAAFIQAARRRRELARAQDDYISLDVKQSSTISGLKGASDEDSESEPDDAETKIPFTPKPQTLRQRMAEETTSRIENTREEIHEGENQDIWEQQQMRKAIKTIQIINIQEIESSMHALLLKQALTIMKRRQDELKHESTHLQQLSRKAETSADENLAIDEKLQRILEEIESRREKRRQTRALSGKCDHQEGTSSDDELTSAEMTDFQNSQDFVQFIWDPLSTSQTTSLITHCRVIFEELSTCENEVNTSKQDLLESIVLRIKKAIEDDVFIPLYPKSAIENKTSPHSKFQERQFWSGLKLFHNILLWNGLLQDDILQELGLGKLLNRYLVIALLNAVPGPEVVTKCNQIVASLPEKWFENSAMRTSIPQLENFTQVLLQSAHKLSTTEFRDEVKEIIHILVKIKALNQAESLIEEYHLDSIKSLIEDI
uniref:GC-rich sequence DNA-binding factor 2 n=1 Tax=Oryctolagus cuniculus TaxID=9986 RepID=G1SFZ5_RABIT